jgi:hypothetical protein
MASRGIGRQSRRHSAQPHPAAPHTSHRRRAQGWLACRRIRNHPNCLAAKHPCQHPTAGAPKNGWHAGAYNTIWNAYAYEGTPINIPYDGTVRWMPDPLGPLFNFVGLKGARPR